MVSVIFGFPNVSRRLLHSEHLIDKHFVAARKVIVNVNVNVNVNASVGV